MDGSVVYQFLPDERAHFHRADGPATDGRPRREWDRGGKKKGDFLPTAVPAAAAAAAPLGQEATPLRLATFELTPAWLPAPPMLVKCG